MKTLSISRILFFLLVPSFLAFGCNDDDDDAPMIVDNEPKEMNIAELAIATENLSSLVAALQAADLVTPFTQSGNYTVFAPTNAAFSTFLSENGFSSLSEVPKALLTEVLLYHVIPAKVESGDLAPGYVGSLLTSSDGNNVSIYFPEGNLTTINGYSNVTGADYMASNGVVHIVDKVLTPPDVVDHAILNPAFSTLVAAVSKANLVDALKDSEAITVFAPTNDAFTQLLSDLQLTSLDDLSAEALTPILLYHVLPAEVRSSDVTEGYQTTLESSSLNISLMDQMFYLDGAAKIVATDVVGTNGIIHVIDKVIMPQTIAGIATINPAFSILVEALSIAGLVDVFTGTDEYTVFAPTNAAFEALLESLSLTSISELSAETLTPILLAHVAAGTFMSGDIQTGNVPTLNDSKALDVVVSESGITIDSTVDVIIPDVKATNGVIHAIDEVIMP